MDTFSMSNSLSKGSVYESDSICVAYLDDAQSRLADGVRPKAISNEEIHRGDDILETYRVEDDAIHGGMGSVWRVHHQSWNVDLAMKRPQPRFFAEGNEARKAEFVAECEHWIDLGLHPNIVSCYYVRDIGGVPTIFSEWMDGGSLKDAIQSGRLYEGAEAEVQARIMDIAIQVARGLQYSHENNLIHQDVKPGNILLTKDWDAKVADFGLAKAQSQLSDGEKPASSGYTLAYCPKEQAEGARAEAWMDVYAWALTVLEMYAGQRNWSTGTEAAERLESLLGLCRVPVSADMCSLLSGAASRAYSGFARILEQMEQVFVQVTGRPFDRPLLQAAPDTADSMNNRALSYLDLGKTEDAVRLWEAAIHTDNSSFRCHYNLAVTLWKANRISASELRQRIESHREDSPLYNQAEADTRFARCRSASDVRHDIQTFGIEEPLPQEPFHDVNRLRQGEKRPGYFTDPYECPLSRGDLYMDESLDGERRIGVDSAGKRYFLEDGQRSKSFYRTYLQDREYMADRNNLNAKRFVDPHGEIVVDNHSAYAVEFFNARTGRSLLSYPLKKDSEGDEILETAQRYTENGYVYIAEFSRPGWWLKLPPADPQLTVSLSRIASFSQRSDAMKRLLHVLPEAEAAFARGDYEAAHEALAPSCEDGTLLLCDPALALWEKLFPFYEPGRLMTVLPTAPCSQRDGRWHAGEGNREEPAGPYTENDASDARTVLTSTYTYYTYENHNNGMDVDIFYSVSASDAASGRPFYTLSFKNSESDDHVFSYSQWFKLCGQYLWLKNPEDTRPTRIDLADIGVQQRMSLCMALPGGYELQNKDGHVRIGEYEFEDTYEGLNLLSDEQIIRCARHAYRLIYRYNGLRSAGEPRENASTPTPKAALPVTGRALDGGEIEERRNMASSSLSIDNTLTKGSVYESDSLFNAYRIDASSQIIGGMERVSISNEQIRRGDEILQTYRVEDDAIHGGMGSVWRVHHSGWNVDLAMKRPQPRFFAEGSEQRKADFIAECEHWINLGLHPNIVSCYYVRDIGGVPSIFSEWMDGGSLKDTIQSGRLYEGTEEEVQERILDIAIQVARGLQYSHENNLIHQDVKPGNILLTEDWDAKVADFGLAKAQSQLSDGEKPLSSGYTLAYCPREQAEGAAAEKWMDVYAWALTVIEMYSGKRTWAQGNEVRGRLGEILEIGRVQVPAGVRNLLDDAIHRAYSGFGRLLERLEQVYGKVCGTACGRPAPTASADTSDSLNNRALSYLDLGKPDEARRLWQRALRADATGFYARYNYELWRWKQGEISDIAFHDAIFRLGVTCDAAALARARISLCRREDIREAERCLEALGQRRSVAPDIREGLNRSLAAWQRILQALPQLPADLFSEASKQAEAMFLPAESFSEAFPGLVAKKGVPLQILEAGTGRIMRQMDVRTAFNTGDEAEEWLQGYMPEGGALLHADYHFRRCIALPDPDIAFSYEPAVVENYRQRRLAEEQAARDHARAMDAWKDGRVAESARILEGSLKRGTLVLHEPSMELWTALGRHFPKKALAAAVETQASASPLPPVSPDPARVCQLEGDVFNQGWACVSCDGITELKLGCSRLVARENLNNNTDAEFTYCVTATDVATGQSVFRIDPFFSRFEDDDTGPFSRYQIRMETPGRLILWSQYEEPRECDILDMPGAGVSIALPGGCELRNTSEGVEIGGVLYSDRFADYRPLFDAEIIPCRNHNYRLIYEYDLSAMPSDSDAKTPAAAVEMPGGGAAKAPPEDESVSADASVPFPEGASATPRTETGEAAAPAIHRGDLLEGGNEVLDDAICGGMNRVWHVRHTDTGAELAMVQPLRPCSDEADSPAVQRFIDAHALWQGIAAHPNVAVCHNVRTLQGVPTAFCEWVDGKSLGESIRDGSLYEGTTEQVESRLFDIARQAALALRHVHGQGLVHCDVKPGNVLISRGCVVRLNDFGLATRCTKQGEAERDEHAPGYTPAYCPAEQAEGKPAKPWMDVYAWALTVLEMYLGERPWRSGAEAKENFDGYLPACRVPLPEGMVTLLRCCLKWKVNDGSVVVRELERIKPASAGESKGAASDAAQQAPGPGAGGPAPSKTPQPAEQRNGDSNESKARGSGLGGFLSRLIFGKKSGCRKGQHDWDGCVCRNCDLERHDFRIAKEAVVQEPGPCCWSSNDDCIGPDCGTPCDAYYPGREGKTITTWRCTRCGLEKVEE